MDLLLLLYFTFLDISIHKDIGQYLKWRQGNCCISGLVSFDVLGILGKADIFLIDGILEGWGRVIAIGIRTRSLFKWLAERGNSARFTASLWLRERILILFIEWFVGNNSMMALWSFSTYSPKFRLIFTRRLHIH